MIQDTTQSIAYIYGNDFVMVEVDRSYLAKCLPYYYTTFVMKQSQL